MEEDLETLKEFLELRELHSSNSIPKSYLTIYQEAVRNLIARYKDLENKIKKYENIIETYIDKIEEIYKDSNKEE